MTKRFQWSKWCRLEKIEQVQDIPSGFGAYVIATTNRRIARAKGSDPDGVLHVGESTYLKDRIYKFRSCARDPKVGTHSAGWRYAHFGLNKQFPVETLRVRWVEARSKEEAYQAEARFLMHYIKSYCELPPLNYKFNWAFWEELLKQWKKL